LDRSDLTGRWFLAGVEAEPDCPDANGGAMGADYFRLAGPDPGRPGRNIERLQRRSRHARQPGNRNIDQEPQMSANVAAALITLSGTTLLALIGIWIRFEHRMTRLEVRMDIADKLEDRRQAIFGRSAKAGES
jgi:hypothetical protein